MTAIVKSLGLAVAMVLLAGSAYAQDSPRPTPPPGFGAQAGMSASDALRDGFNIGLAAGGEIAALRARIAELERVCGEPCKPKPAEQPK